MLDGFLRHGQQGRRTGGVVDGAVPDVVALACSPFVDAQVVPVGRVDHGFRLQLGSVPGTMPTTLNCSIWRTLLLISACT
jgi:ABC-type sulfate transport system substrate-binding protein